MLCMCVRGNGWMDRISQTCAVIIIIIIIVCCGCLLLLSWRFYNDVAFSAKADGWRSCVCLVLLIIIIIIINSLFVATAPLSKEKGVEKQEKNLLLSTILF